MSMTIAIDLLTTTPHAATPRVLAVGNATRQVAGVQSFPSLADLAAEL